jgi:2,3-bisphosphoglycerate-dependent phosphoglycerate mutase
MLDDISDTAIVELNIPTGVPLLYDLDDKLRPRGSRYLGDAEAIKARAEAVARQTESAARFGSGTSQLRKPPSTTRNSPVT